MWLGLKNNKLTYEFYALDEMQIKSLYEVEVEKTLQIISLKIKADERCTLVTVLTNKLDTCGVIIDKLRDLTGSYHNTDKLVSIKKYIEIVSSYKTKE